MCLDLKFSLEINFSCSQILSISTYFQSQSVLQLLKTFMDLNHYPVLKCITDCKSTQTSRKFELIRSALHIVTFRLHRTCLNSMCCIAWSGRGESPNLPPKGEELKVNQACTFSMFLLKFCHVSWEFKQVSSSSVLATPQRYSMWLHGIQEQLEGNRSPCLFEILYYTNKKTSGYFANCRAVSQPPGCLLTHLYSLLPSSQDGTEKDTCYCRELRARGSPVLHSTCSANDCQ